MDLKGILRVTSVMSVLFHVLMMMMGLMMRKGREHILREDVYGESKGEDDGKSRRSDSVCLIIRNHKVKQRFIYRGNLALPFPVLLFKNGQITEMKVSS